jgi:hypothetical protein
MHSAATSKIHGSFAPLRMTDFNLWDDSEQAVEGLLIGCSIIELLDFFYGAVVGLERISVTRNG